MTLYEETKGLIKIVTEDALATAKEKGLLQYEEIPAYLIEEPREKSFGDFSVNAAMLMAKQARMAPRAIADIIVSEMVTENTYIKEVSVAGAGFINFKLDPAYVTRILERSHAYG